MSPPLPSAAKCPVGTARCSLLVPHGAGNGGQGAACRFLAAVYRLACGGRRSGRAGTGGAHRRRKKKAGAALPYLT